MSKLKFEREFLECDIYGDIHKISYPTPRQVKSYLEGLRLIINGESEKTDMELVVELLDSLGLPKEVSENMALNQLSQISDELLQKKS